MLQVFFSFEVPLMYGNTSVALQFYGPYGEERREERIINIPYNFVPEKNWNTRLALESWKIAITGNFQGSR